jgi:hypothetical protein
MKESFLLYVGGIGFTEFLTIGVFLMVPVLLWVWAIIDLLKSHFPDSVNKVIWAIVIVFIPVLGPLLYLFLGRNQQIKLSKG